MARNGLITVILRVTFISDHSLQRKIWYLLEWNVDKTSKNEFFYQFKSPPDIFFWHLYIASEFVLSSQKEWYHKKTYVFELLWRLYLLFNKRFTFVGSLPFHLRKDLNFHEICKVTFRLKVVYPSGLCLILYNYYCYKIAPNFPIV